MLCFACICIVNSICIIINHYYLLIYLDPLLAEKICCCMQDISSMGRVVVGVTGVVVGFNHL